jgi:hypothetical protein
MGAIPQVNLANTNSYFGDNLTLLAQTFNSHNHPLASSNNFLTYNLNYADVVGFVGVSQSSSDPFGAIGNAVPLTVVSVSADSLALSRVANTSTLGSLTYFNLSSSSYSVIDSLSVTQGSNLLTFNSTRNRTGFATPNLISKALTRYLTTDVAVFLTGTNEPITRPITETISIDLNSNLFYVAQGYTNSQPNLQLIRGQKYLINLTPQVVSAGSFYLVNRLRDPIYGLDLVKLGVSQVTSPGTIEYTVPYDAPSQLFYQSSLNKNNYGSIFITGGTVIPDPALWQPNQTTLQVPLNPPHQEAVMLMSTASPYRLGKLEVYPQWSLATAPKDVYVQLQYITNNTTVTALSPLVRLTNFGIVSIQEGLSSVIIPTDALLIVAIYSPVNLKRLSFQLTTTELLDG